MKKVKIKNIIKNSIKNILDIENYAKTDPGTPIKIKKYKKKKGIVLWVYTI